jgi:hypothetical protein
LTFQVKRPGGRSDKAVGHLQDNFGSSAAGALRNRLPLYTVALSQRDHLFTP